MKLYVLEFERCFPGHVGRWVCTTPLCPTFRGYGATKGEARRRAAEHVKMLRREGLLP